MKKAIRRAIPSTDSLVIFDVCARAVSFTRAGGELGLTQSAVSRQILDLEQFLNVTLFDRSGRHLTLTRAGREYWEQIMPLLDELEARTVRMQLRNTLRNSLNLSVAASFCNRWLIPKLPQFLQVNPGVLVNVTSRVGPIDLMKTGFDAAIVNAPMAPPAIASELLFPIRLAAFASPAVVSHKNKLTGRQIAALPLLHVGGMPEAWKEYLGCMGVKNAVVSAVGHYSLWLLSCEAALAGMGVALLPPELVTADVRAGRLVQVSDIEISRRSSYWLAWRQNEEDAPALIAFQDWLRSRIAYSRTHCGQAPGRTG